MYDDDDDDNNNNNNNTKQACVWETKIKKEQRFFT